MSTYTHPVLIVEAPIEVLLGDLSGAVRALEYARRALLGAARVMVGARLRMARGIVSDAAEWIAEFLGHTPGDAHRPGRVTVQALLGSTLSILSDHRIPALFLPSRAWAEYAAAWLARRVWRRWLLDHPDGLAAERERLAAACSFCQGSGDPCACNDGQTPTPQPASVARVSEAGGMPASTAEYQRRREAKRRTA